MSETPLGPMSHSFGRDESPREQWRQAVLLGLLLALFVAPGVGFPILQRGPRYATFFAALIALGAGLVLLVRLGRRNAAVRVHHRGVALVEGRDVRAFTYERIAAIRYEPGAGLTLDLDDGTRAGLRLPPAAGLGALEAVRAVRAPGFGEGRAHAG